MLDILKYFWRRKMRTALTVLAVTVGIFAVTAVGGIAEQLNRSIAAYEQDPYHRIIVVPRDYSEMLGDAFVRQVRRLKGVAGVISTVSGNLKPADEDAAVQISVNPESFVGVQSDVPGLEYEPPSSGLKLWAGRLPSPTSHTETVVTWALADSKGLKVGDTLLIRERPFTVVGIWEKSPTSEGRTATINYDVAMDMIGEFVYMQISIIPEPDVDPEALAVGIEELFPEALAYSPIETVVEARQQVMIFSAVVGASGVMSLLIGTFTIVNTMAVSVQERRREIGLKKALGAEDGHILREVVIEAVMIAVIGAVVGVGGGFLVGTAANQWLTTGMGMQLYVLTPRLGIGVVVFSIVMGAVAGIYPAWRAARLDPVVALRDSGSVSYAGRGLKRLLYLIGRNARNIFTVGGIAIGIFALVVLGSLTEALTTYIRDVTDMTEDLVMVVPDSHAPAPVTRSTARLLRRMPGVRDVILTNTDQLYINFSGQEGGEEKEVQVWASESRTGDMGMAMPVRNEIAVGRFVAPGSKDEIVLGAGLAASVGANVGDVVLIDNRLFTVVGIWGKIAFDMGGFDMSGYMSMEALAWLQGNVDAIAGVALRAESVEAAHTLATSVKEEMPGLDVVSLIEILGSIQQVFMGLIGAMVGIFSIAVFVGSISVINTMVIAVNEQTRQIGLKKAIGAENGDILAEVLMDAAKLGGLGGLLGVGMAWVTTLILNPVLRAQIDLDILQLSPRLAIGAVIFSIVLGMVSGLLPARRASQLDPVIALHAD
ncbi:MAG: ABC transporter permease [Anaerolineae bacterium]|nr:ABC transporter permease [Anaerolineae bacterium]